MIDQYQSRYITRKHSLSQLPSEFRKKPVAHLAHAVPLVPAVQPALQVHVPSALHTPFKQLHVDGAFVMIGSKHRPLPVIPSSQDAQSAGHA